MADDAPAEPVLLYHPDVYDAARDDPQDRHFAGESFLSAFLASMRGPDAFAMVVRDEHFAAFEKAAKAAPRLLTPRRVGRHDIKTLRKHGVLYSRIPNLAEEAQLRGFLGDHVYAVCGMVHTIAARAVIDAVAQIATAPVQPWDALVCHTAAVHAALTRILNNTEEQLRSRIGAQTFIRPMMPVIPLGIHARRFVRTEAARLRWRSELGIDDKATVVLYCGRLSVHAQSSPFQLAQALEIAAGKGARLEMIWCGWFKDDFQQKSFMTTAKAMAPSVRFHHLDGRKPDVRSSIWSAADIFCSLPDNIHESSGLTAVEAMAAELPVMAANWGGSRDIIKHGVTGVLIDTYMPAVSLADVAFRYMSGIDSYDSYIGGVSQFCIVNVDQTAQWIATFAADPAMRRTIGNSARQAVLKNHDWAAVLPRYRALWGEQRAFLEKARTAGSPPSIGWRGYDPAQTFAGFPSHRINDTTRLARGPHYELWDELTKMPGTVINPHVLMRAADFAALREAFGDDRPRTTQDVIKAFPEPLRPLTVRALHWLVKIGLLRLMPTEGTSGSPPPATAGTARQ
jgi:starch synthase